MVMKQIVLEDTQNNRSSMVSHSTLDLNIIKDIIGFFIYAMTMFQSGPTGEEHVTRIWQTHCDMFGWKRGMVGVVESGGGDILFILIFDVVNVSGA
jgi:hypothetical protein